MGQLKGLSELGLTYNLFSTLPDELVGCTGLTSIWLNQCLFTALPLVRTETGVPFFWIACTDESVS